MATLYPAQLAPEHNYLLARNPPRGRSCLKPRGLRLQAGCQGDRRAPFGRLSSSGCSGLDPIGANHGPYNSAGRQAVHFCQRSAHGWPAYEGSCKGKSSGGSGKRRVMRVGGHKEVGKRLKLCLVRYSTGPHRTAGCRPHLEPRPGRRAPNSHNQLFYARKTTQNKTQGFTPIVNKHRVLGYWHHQLRWGGPCQGQHRTNGVASK